MWIAPGLATNWTERTTNAAPFRRVEVSAAFLRAYRNRLDSYPSQKLAHCFGKANRVVEMHDVSAIKLDQACIAPMVHAFRERHEFIWSALNAMPGVRCVRAGGAFYAYPYVGEAIEALHASGRLAQPTDFAFSAYLLEKALVAVVPGSAFGTEGYVRISFATSMANLEKAMARMSALCQGHPLRKGAGSGNRSSASRMRGS